MQFESNTIIVLSSSLCGFHEVELPWLSERKARAAIPYALEEQIAQKLSTLHFSFDRAHHQNNRYLVAVVDKTYLHDLISQLDAEGIDFNDMTLDWFALKSGEVCVTPSFVLARTEMFQGALVGELATIFLSKCSDMPPVYSFTDSSPNWKTSTLTPIDSSFYVWVALRVQKLPHINLCQGELSHGENKELMNRRWTMAAGALAGIWLFVVLLVNCVDLIRLNAQVNRVDEEIAVVYRQFFPGTKTIISPRFRVSQLLNAGHARQDSIVLWQLLEKLDKAFDPKHLTVTQLDYKSNALLVTLKGEDFSTLESLSNSLQQAHVKVQQTQASSHDDNVTAILELRL